MRALALLNIRNNMDAPLYIGLMSGTSLDGVDAVLVSIPEDYTSGPLAISAAIHMAFDESLVLQLKSLQSPGENEIEREALAANELVHVYGKCVFALLDRTGIQASGVRAIGAHGQTVRHHPAKGYTRQINNPALLAEMTGIDVIADFRSRDIAAGGQGAPLVPAFHRAIFSAGESKKTVVNIGGIANISILDPDSETAGFDTGPGNVLMDSWISRNLNQPYDAAGRWARSGKISERLLSLMLAESYLGLLPPKSTGRDLFNDRWMDTLISSNRKFTDLPAEDIQATLCAFTARTIADAVFLHAGAASEVLVCGGGAKNVFLVELLEEMIQARMPEVSVASTSGYGIDPTHIEALAFAWLANRFTHRLAGNIPEVTGARGYRVLGALYPAALGEFFQSGENQ